MDDSDICRRLYDCHVDTFFDSTFLLSRLSRAILHVTTTTTTTTGLHRSTSRLLRSICIVLVRESSGSISTSGIQRRSEYSIQELASRETTVSVQSLLRETIHRGQTFFLQDGDGSDSIHGSKTISSTYSSDSHRNQGLQGRSLRIHQRICLDTFVYKLESNMGIVLLGVRTSRVASCQGVKTQTLVGKISRH